MNVDFSSFEFKSKALLLTQMVFAGLILWQEPLIQAAHQDAFGREFAYTIAMLAFVLSGTVLVVASILVLILVCAQQLDIRAVPVFIFGLVVASTLYFIPAEHRNTLSWLDFRNQMLFWGTSIAFSGVGLTWLFLFEISDRQAEAA